MRIADYSAMLHLVVPGIVYMSVRPQHQVLMVHDDVFAVAGEASVHDVIGQITWMYALPAGRMVRAYHRLHLVLRQGVTQPLPRRHVLVHCGIWGQAVVPTIDHVSC